MIKQVELFGGPYDGLNIKIRETDNVLCFDTICFRQGQVVVISETYQTANRFNCRGIEIFERENRVNV